MEHCERKVPEDGRGRQSGSSATGISRPVEPRRVEPRPANPRPARLRAIWLAALLAGASAACGASDDPPRETRGAPDSAAGAAIALGVDILLRDSLQLLEGRRIGLITNHTGLSWPARPYEQSGSSTGGSTAPGRRLALEDGVSTIDRLAAHPSLELVGLFSPEHGIRGRAEAGEAVGSGVDSATALPVHSLYGETRRPTPAMLEGIDVLIFDIQDIGARYYTYVWTMALAMAAAGEQRIPFVVLDRPNPIDGVHVQGNVLDPDFATFVGLYPVPMRHGLTAGEMARLLVGEFGLDVQLTVVPMEGWSRREGWPDGMPFVPPSPNMPSVESALHYPGTCLFEGTNLSVGRGTDRAFQWIGAPWLDAVSVAARVDGVVATSFTPDSPGDGKYDGVPVRALEFQATGPDYDPTLTAVAVLKALHDIDPDRLEWNVEHFDRLAGTNELREGIMAGEPLDRLVSDWEAQQREFEELRKPYLLY